MKLPNNYKILIAEDSSFDMMILKRIFSKLGYGYAIVENSHDVLKELNQTPYDLILIDVEMSGMDGIALVRKIREEYGEVGRQIPIIAMTGGVNSEIHKEILDAGMNDYLEKPFKTEVFQEKLQTHLAALDAGRIEEKEPHLSGTIESQPLYNLTYLYEVTDSDIGFLQKLISYFVTSAPAVLDSIKINVAQELWVELGQIVHKFASELAIFGINQLDKDIYELEQLVKNPTDTQRIRILSQNIGTVCEQVIKQLKIDFPEFEKQQNIILLCEDDFMLSKTVEYKLKKDGYIVIAAENGKVAAEILKKEKVDLVITDLLMPYMSGLELIVLVRNEMKLSLPILVLSRIGLEKTVLQAFDLGADDYLVKPFSPLELGIRVKKLLSQDHTHE